MINFDDYTNENKTEHNLKWPHILDHLYHDFSGSGKTNALLNFINNQSDIDKIYLYAKDPYEAKYQYFINKLKLILKLLWIIQMICKMFTKILKITIQIKNVTF